jgi:GR25 family glycosyltransferase involved in LPS biosynthesis
MDIRKVTTFLINLDHNKDRLEHATKNLQQLGISPQRFPAVYGKKLDKDYLDTVIHPYVWYTIENGQTTDPDIQSLGAVGCSLSHISLWQKLVDSSEEVFHITEDDACVNASSEKVNAFLKEVEEIDPDWDVVYIGYNPCSIYKQISISPTVQKINSLSFGTQSYLIRKKGAEKLLRKAFPISQHVDTYMSIMAAHAGVRSYRPSKPFVKQPLIPFGAMASDISSISLYKLKAPITRLPTSILLMSVLISIFVIVYFIIKGVAKQIKMLTR